MTIIALIISIIALVINTIILINVLPYSDNNTICNIQMTIERTINHMLEMK